MTYGFFCWIETVNRIGDHRRKHHVESTHQQVAGILEQDQANAHQDAIKDDMGEHGRQIPVFQKM